jgi:hypothetical protein
VVGAAGQTLTATQTSDHGNANRFMSAIMLKPGIVNTQQGWLLLGPVSSYVNGNLVDSQLKSLRFTGSAISAATDGFGNITVSIAAPNFSSLYVGTTPVFTGTSGNILYNNSGSLGEYSLIPVAKGGTGTATPALVAGTNVTISGSWPNQTINATGGSSGITVGTTTITGGTAGNFLYNNAGVVGERTIIAVANGGTGTATPSLVAGTNVTITGSWPNQTINASGSGGSLTVQSSGTSLGTATTLNFTGSGVTTALASGTATVTISGGGGGASSTASTNVAFGNTTITTGSGSFGSGLMLYTSAYVPAGVNISSVSVEVPSAATGTWYGAIYSDNGSGSPSTRLALSAAQTNMVTGINSAPVTYTSTGQYLWFAVSTQFAWSYNTNSNGNGVYSTSVTIPPSTAPSPTVFSGTNYCVFATGYGGSTVATPANVAPVVRATSQAYIVSGTSLTINLPTGTVVNDLVVITMGGIYGLNAYPTGWSGVENQQGTNWNGAAFYKVMSSADIAAGNVTMTVAGGGYDIVATAVTIKTGTYSGLGTYVSQRNGSGSSSITLTTDTSPTTNDYMIYFGSNRGTSVNTVSLGTLAQQINDGSLGSAVLNVSPISTTGALSPVFNYATAGAGNYQIALKVLGAYAIPGSTPTGMYKLAQVTTSGSQSSVTFSSISSAYSDLIILVAGRSTDSIGNNNFVYVQCNSDTGTNYSTEKQYSYDSNTGVGQTTATTSLLMGYVPNAGATTNHAGSCEAVIPNYKGTTFYKNMIATMGVSLGTGGYTQGTGVFGGTWLNTSAINALVVYPSGGSWADGTVVTLYGRG